MSAPWLYAISLFLLQQPRPPASPATPLRLAWIDYEANTESKYRALARYLSRKLDIPIDAVPIENYDYRHLAASMSAAALSSSRIDVAIFTPYTFVAAKTLVPGLEAFATYKRGGTSQYRAYIVWKAASPYKKLDDVLNDLKTDLSKKIAFVDSNSTSGYIWPVTWLLARKGIDVDRDMASVFAGSHTRALEFLVRRTDVVACAVWDGGYEAF